MRLFKIYPKKVQTLILADYFFNRNFENGLYERVIDDIKCVFTVNEDIIKEFIIFSNKEEFIDGYIFVGETSHEYKNKLLKEYFNA